MKTNTKHWASITAGILSLAGYASATNIGSEKYTYDTSGNIVEKSLDGQVTKMTYDASNRLTERQTTGQCKETTTYDAAGRSIAMNDGTGQSTRSMSYGYSNKVLNTRNHGTNTGLFYNAEGQLVGTNSAGRLEAFAWDGLVMVSRGEQVYVNESNLAGGVPAMIGNEVAVTDIVGSTLNVGDKSFNSSAYGEGLEGGFFTGKPFIEGIGGFIFKYRSYSAADARWTSADPSGFPDGTNAFSYSMLNPITNVDPLGLKTWTLDEPPAGAAGTQGESSPKKPTRTAWVTGTNEIRWAKQWSATGWFHTAQSATGPENSAWTGTLAAGTTQTQTMQVGFQDAPFNISYSNSEATTTGSSQSKTFAAVPGTAYEMRGVVKTGDYTLYEAKWVWHSKGYWYMDTSYGTNGIRKTVTSSDNKIPTLIGFEVWKES